MTAMTNGDTAMTDDDTFAGWTAPEPSERLDDFDSFMNPPGEETADALNDDAEIDASVLNAPPRPRKAVQYENKVSGVVRFGIKALLMNPRTIADGATLIKYGPDFCIAVGDLAADNPNVAKTVDFLLDGTENTTLAFVAATLPIALQIMRNHEPVAEAQTAREIRVPFTKRTIKMKVKIKLPWRARMFTDDPVEMTTRVLTNADVAAALAKQGIKIHAG